MSDSDSDLAPLQSARPELAPGASYHRLVVVEVVSRSGVGVLYLARDAEGVPCYLRTLDAAQIDTDELIFAKADLARLRGVVHRNVARVLGGDVVSGELHYTLEAQGTSSLLDVVRGARPLEEAELVWLGRGITAGLSALHGAGLHHGGLTPSSVIVTLHGPILVDLGWADRLGSAEQLPREQGQRADLGGVRELLAFAAAPGGGRDLAQRWPRLGALWVRLALDSSEPFADAADAAAAFRQLAQSLRLPDPIAPASLRGILEPSARDPLEASREQDPLALSREGATPLFEGAPRLAPSEARDLSPLMASAAEDQSAAEFDSALVSGIESASDVTALGGPPPFAGTESDLLASAVRQRDTLAYARAALVEADAAEREEERRELKESGALAGLQPSGEDSSAVGSESSRADRGEAPALGPFGDYELIRQLEAFATRTRFVATHPDQPRGVVVEVLVPAALPDEAARRRFLRGAESAQAVEVPGVARVFAAGQVEAWCYLASEHVSAPTLATLLAEEPDLSGRAPALLAQVLRLVEQAHHQGVVHGALEPEVVHLEADGTLRLSGFGFARLPVRARLARRYYPDSREERDEADDIVACGHMLYEALTGRHPSDVPRRLFLSAPPPPSVLCPDLAPALDSILGSALAPAGEGYPSAGEFAHDLEHLARAPSFARPLPARARFGLALARHGFALLVLAGLAAGGSVLAGVGAASLARSEPPKPSPTSPAFRSQDPSPASTALQVRLEGELARLERTNSQQRETLAKLEAERAALRAEAAQAEAASALRLVTLGEADLAAGAPEAAERAFAQALALTPGHARAEAGRARAREAREALARGESPEPLEPSPREEPRPSADAREALAAGAAHLAAGRFEAARRELLSALADGQREALPLLERLPGELAGAARVAREQEARALRTRAQSRLEAKDFAAAEASFLDALALEPDHAAARAGLRAAIQAGSSGRAPSPDTASARRQQASREAAERHALRGRELYASEGDYEGAIDAYFQSLHHHGRADALDPQMPSAGAQTQRLLGEFVAILRQEGEASFASLLLRFYGLDPARVPALQPPQDEYLVIEEADALQIRRTFGGAVRFVPERRFAALRVWIKEQGARFRVQVQVSTRIGPEQPPKLYVRGLSLRVEDREARTLSAPLWIEFEGGPYQRIVRVDARGRQVLPWDRSHPLDADAYVARVTSAVEELLAARRGR